MHVMILRSATASRGSMLQCSVSSTCTNSEIIYSLKSVSMGYETSKTNVPFLRYTFLHIGLS